MKLLFIFIILNVANVIIQTAKSIITIKGTKIVAALTNAIAYGLYTIVLIYMTCNLNMWLKAGIVAICNLIGVYVVKLIEERTQKEKLWKIELTTIDNQTKEKIAIALRDLSISYSTVETSKRTDTIFNIYCIDKKQSQLVKDIVGQYEVKYFVTESKNL